jgi:GGDEF domain-containing protein
VHTAGRPRSAHEKPPGGAPGPPSRRGDGLRDLLTGIRLATPGSAFDWLIEDRDVAAVTRAMQRCRHCLAIIAVAGAAVVPGLEASDRFRVVALVANIWVLWSIVATRLVAGMERRPARVATFTGDLVAIFLTQLAAPALSHPALFAYVLVVAFYTYLGGRLAGLLASTVAGILTGLAWWWVTPTMHSGLFVVATFTAALMGLTLVVHRATREQRQRAQEMRAASPLTGLPGNLRIDEELRTRIAGNEPVALLHLDLDQFKAFNDRYGFLRGDQAIGTLAGLLREAAERFPGTFVGHVGGDDFVVVSRPEHVESLGKEVAAHFDSEVPGLYDPEDAARGYIEVIDRRGEMERVPLLSVSIGAATTAWRAVSDHRELVQAATEMKQHAKRQMGSTLSIDRRRN